MRVNLLERGILSNELVRDIDLEVAAEIEDAVSFAENSPSPDPMEIHRDVYAPDASDLVVGRQA
jgi:pyruvate dehydrogenase E1 component alpha subunit